MFGPLASRRHAAAGAMIFLALLLLPLGALAQGKPPLDHDTYDIWNRIQQEELSPDGTWFHYRAAPGHGDATLFVRQVNGDQGFEIPRGQNASFTRDGAFMVFRIAATLEAQETARKDRNTPTPRDSLGILTLATGEMEKLPRIRTVTVPDQSSEWIVIHRHAPRAGQEEPEDEAPEEVEQEQEEAQERESARDKDPGTDLHFRNLRTGQERVFASVSSYAVHEDGSPLVFAVSSKNGASDGVFLVTDEALDPHPLLRGEGEYARLTLDREGRQAAFLTNRDTWAAEEDKDLEHALYLATLDGPKEARNVAGSGTEGIPRDWRVSEKGSVSFSHDGARLFFGAAPPPPGDPDEDDEMLSSVKVDVWSWHDPLLQPNQLVDLNRERDRTYQAVLHISTNRVVQLEDEALPSVSVGNRGTADVALGTDDRPYQRIISWDTRFTDHYLVNPHTGERERIATKLRSSASLSPEARWVYWWDGGDFQGDLPTGWMVMDLASREVRNVTEAIPHPVFNEISDRPAPPGSYGLAGWTENDERMVVYDAHDLWLVDPRGRDAPVSLTEGYGRANDLRFRVVRLDSDQHHLPPDEDVLLSAFHGATKASGFYRTRLDGPRPPVRLVMGDLAFAGLTKSTDADVLLFSKRTFQMFPDLWTASADFRGQQRLTNVNPQQNDYNWGSAELMTWTSADGEELQGILYKPENFDPSRKWPMMVYFYERSSDGLHGHFIPGTGTSINRSFYVSRGYVLFLPDIPYKTGYPGESAMNAILPGITAIVDQGFIDRERIGVQGHSWGGYQIAYMVTRTNIFAAAEAGAPVSNMTSAYGGIRWASGRVRQMQYETGQSRIGGTLWDAQHRFIENSPLFTAYKVETPLLILHNDEDGAVPWEEGIQLFVALRRLDKPTWLVNYNGQGHGVSGRFPQLDWTIRMQQFFDHYLQDAPPPTWMVHGVPALQKGRTLGLELVEGDAGEGPRRGSGGGRGG